MTPILRLTLCSLATALFFVPAAIAAILPTDPDYEEGNRALANNLPEIAVAHYNAVVNRHREDLEPDELKHLCGRLMESTARAGLYEKAVEWAEAADISKYPGKNFWYGISLAKVSRFNDAERELKSASEPGAPHRFEAIVFRVHSLRTLQANKEALELLSTIHDEKDAGQATYAKLQTADILLKQRRPTEAAAVIKKIADAPNVLKPLHQFLQAKLDLQQGNYAAAEAAFRRFAAGKDPLPSAIARAAPRLLVDTLIAAGKTVEAAQALVAAIDSGTSSPTTWPENFELLVTIAGKTPDEVSAALDRWRAEKGSPRAPYATYYHARVLHNQQADAAQELALLNPLVSRSGEIKVDDFIRNRALYRITELQIKQNDSEAAKTTLAQLAKEPIDDELKPRVDFLRGMTEYTAEEYKTARLAFMKAAGSAQISGSETADLLYNVAVSAIAQNSNKTFNKSLEQIVSRGRLEDQATLRLERALFKARHSPAAGKRALQEFYKLHGDHLRLPEAHLALAELSLEGEKPDVGYARGRIAAASVITKDDPQYESYHEHIDYLNIWIAETEGNKETIDACIAYLKSWPDGGNAEDVTMKLAETYFRTGDFPNAQTRFEEIAKQWPAGKFADPALYFAGRAVMQVPGAGSVDKAVGYWGQVAAGGGPLSLEAKRQQAAAKLGQKLAEEALATLDDILKTITENPDHPGVTQSIIHATLFDKAESLYELSTDQPDRLDAAVVVLDKIIKDPAAPAFWKNQAHFRKGACLEKNNKPDEALKSYSEVTRGEVLNKNTPPEELLWYYRCGFAEVRILESRKRWEAAVAVLDRLARSPGERSKEAHYRSEMLKLDHLIWDKVAPASPSVRRRSN